MRARSTTPQHQAATRLPRVLLLLALLCACPLALAQPVGPLARTGSAFVNLVSVRTMRLANATRVEMRFDGTFELWADPVERKWVDFSLPDEPFAQTQAISFRVVNARSQAGAFFDVSSYPVSHVEVSVPVGATEGIGLDVTVQLYVPATFGGLTVERQDWSGWHVHPPAFYIQESQDRRGLIITVTSDRQGEPPLVRKSEADAAKLRRKLDIRMVGGMLSVDAVNADLHSFSEALAAATGQQITVDDDAQRMVSVFMPATTLEEVLDALCKGYSLTSMQVGDSLVITQAGPTAGSRFVALHTRTVPLRYIRAEAAVDLLPVFLRRFIRPAQDANAVVISGPTYLADKVQADLGKLDRPGPQMEVEVTAVDLSHAADLEAALELSAATNALSAATGSDAGDVWYSTTGQLSAEYAARLHAIATADSTHVLARARASVSNGKTAKLFVGTTRLIQVRFMNYYAPGPPRQDQTIINVDIGTKLSVTPWSGGDGNVTITLEPEVVNMTSRDPVTGLPSILTRRYRGTVRTRAGDTVIIGGLKQRVELPVTRKIPVLGDLPLIGWMFRSRRKSVDTSEIALLVTPRLIGDGKVARSIAPAAPGGEAS